VRLLAQSREFTSRPANEDAYNSLPLRSLHFVRAPPGAGFTLEERLATP
jgi:hypothetical protein